MIQLQSKGALSWQFSVVGNTKTYLCLHVKCPTFLTDFKEIYVFSADFHKVPTTKFQSYPTRGSRADICGQTDGHDEGNRRFSRLCIREKGKKVSMGNTGI